MNPQESNSNPEHSEAPPPASASEAGLPPAARPSDQRLWIFLGTAGVVAGVVSALIGEFTYQAVVPPTETVFVMGVPVEITPRPEAVSAGIKNSALTFGGLGGILGLALGIAGGLARRSIRGTWIAGLLGMVLGAVVGAGTAFVLVPMYYQYEDRMEEQIGQVIVVPMLLHAGIWASIGAVSGLAAGLGLGGGWNQAARTLLGGLVGAAVGTALYEVIGVFAFPMAQTTQPLSDPDSFLTRFLARLLVCAFTAVGVVLALTAEAKKRPPASLET